MPTTKDIEEGEGRDNNKDYRKSDGRMASEANFAPAAPPSSTTPILELSNISKEYTGNFSKKTLVLKDINLAIHHNEFISIVGPSGCGKSTLLRIMMGLDSYTSGAIMFKGERMAPGK